MTGEPPLCHHAVPGRGRLAYRLRAGRPPTVVYLGGYQSSMTGRKAMAVDAVCRARGLGCLRFDYSGHGASDPAPAPGEQIGRWRAEVGQLLGGLPEPPLVLVGSSMGAWLMLLAALDRAAPIAGLLGLAAAPDFTEDLIWRRLSHAAHRQLLNDGWATVPSEVPDAPYRISYAMIREARRHFLLRRRIPLTYPLRLIHGMADTTIPWTTATRLADCYAGDDVAIQLVKRGDHRLSDDTALALLRDVLGELLDSVG